MQNANPANSSIPFEVFIASVVQQNVSAAL